MKYLVLLCALGLASCTAPSGVKTIVGARLGSIEHSVVIVENGKIQAVGEQSQVPVPKGSEIISGLGKTLEPVPGGEPIEPGRPANLILKGDTVQTMRQGEWVK